MSSGASRATVRHIFQQDRPAAFEDCAFPYTLAYRTLGIADKLGIALG